MYVNTLCWSSLNVVYDIHTLKKMITVKFADTNSKPTGKQ